MKLSSGIYKITNLINQKCYIGKSSNIEKRFSYHKTNYTNPKEWNKTLYKAIRKYQLENFSFEIIEFIELDEYNNQGNTREKYWIQFYNSFNNGYNETKGGDGGVTVENPRQKYGKLTEEEVLYLRQRYIECKYPASYIWQIEFQQKITKRGFQAIWLGENAKNIMPEVFTEENKNKQLKLSRAYEGVLRRRINLSEKNKIKQRIQNGEKARDIWKNEYSSIYKSYTGFNDMLQTISLDEEVNLNGEQLEKLQAS